MFAPRRGEIEAPLRDQSGLSMSATHEPTVDKKIEEIPSDDEEAPGLEPVENPELASGGGKRQNRNEKKVRKHLAKTGLVAVSGVTKVSVRKQGQVRKTCALSLLCIVALFSPLPLSFSPSISLQLSSQSSPRNDSACLTSYGTRF